MTFFWNGNRSGYFDENLETYVEIPSDTVPFNEAPDMKAREITEAGKEALLSGKYNVVRINYANPGTAPLLQEIYHLYSLVGVSAVQSCWSLGSVCFCDFVCVRFGLVRFGLVWLWLVSVFSVLTCWLESS